MKINFSISEFLTASGAKNSKNFYRHILDCIDLLQTTQVKWEDTEHNYGMSVIPYYKHEKNSGVVEIHVNKELVRTVLAVTQHEHFSFLKKYLFRLDNAQAIKIFPFLLSWRNRGENMIRFEDGTVRYFTVLEAKRLQGFPDDFVIHGAWGEAMRQLGNAVPVRLAEVIGKQLSRVLSTEPSDDADRKSVV